MTAAKITLLATAACVAVSGFGCSFRREIRIGAPEPAIVERQVQQPIVAERTVERPIIINRTVEVPPPVVSSYRTETYYDDVIY